MGVVYRFIRRIVQAALLVAALLLIQFMPKAALADPCWVRSSCESTGGVWDSEHQNQPPCTKFGEQDMAKCFVKVPDITLQVAIPGLSDRDAEGRPVIKGGFPAYMAAFYKFFVAALVVIAVVMVMWGGFKRIMAAGSPERVKSANETIIGAITGVVIALISYSLLSLVNPNLVKNFGLNIEKIKPESYGDKCPLDTNYGCGEIGVVDGKACIGMVCTAGKGGCYKTGITGEKDASGKKWADYDCLQAWEACEKIDANNIEELHGISPQDFWAWSNDTAVIGALNAICYRYVPNSCFWVHSTTHADKCDYYSEAAKAAACTNKTKCSDFNTYTGENFVLQTAVGSDFAACAYNWCPGLNCKIVAWRGQGLGFKPKNVLDLISGSWYCYNK